MSQPQFSVVVPTRGRPETLRYTLRTCFQQQHADYEVVVCDNSDSPATRGVVDQFACDRLRYVRTPEILAMTDNWNLALSHTRGEFVIYIGDDDGLLPHALTQLAGLLARTSAKALSWESALYSWPTFVIPEEANVLVVPLTRDVETVESKPRLQDILTRRADLASLPNIYHGVVHREVIDRVRNATGRVFHGVCPDTVSSISFAHVAGSFVSTTVPFSVSGFSGASNHAGFRLMTNNHPSSVDTRILNGKAGHRLHPWVPDVHCSSIVLADSFLRAKANLFPDDDDLVLDRRLMATWHLSELPYSDPELRRQAIEKIRGSLKDSGELAAWFDSLDHASFPPVPPTMLPRGEPAFNGHSLALDATSFGVHDVAAAAKLCADLLRYPANDLPLDIPNFARIAHSLHLHVQDLDSRLTRMQADYARDVSLRNVPRRVLRKFIRMILPQARSA